jgi:hypothetical protein
MHTIKDTSLFCCYCGEKFSFGTKLMTSDHLIPVSRGGKNAPYNKRNCCSSCNSNKGSMFPEKFLLHILKKQSRLAKYPCNKAVSAQIYKYEAMIENIKYIVEYVQSAGEKLFIDKYH